MTLCYGHCRVNLKVIAHKITYLKNTSSTTQEIYILNENNEKKIINFFSDEMLENVQIEDSTV